MLEHRSTFIFVKILRVGARQTFIRRVFNLDSHASAGRRFRCHPNTNILCSFFNIRCAICLTISRSSLVSFGAGRIKMSKIVNSRFREEFNYKRPHDVLNQEKPASIYQPSRREKPDKLPLLEYPDRFEVRQVNANSSIR